MKDSKALVPIAGSRHPFPADPSEEDVKALNTKACRIVSLMHSHEAILAARWRVAVRLAETEEMELKALRKRLERAQLLSGRRSGLSVPSPGRTGLQPAISDVAIERLALRAVIRFHHLPPHEAERAWQRFRDELAERLPPLTAAEVLGRADDLRQLAEGDR